MGRRRGGRGFPMSISKPAQPCLDEKAFSSQRKVLAESNAVLQLLFLKLVS